MSLRQAAVGHRVTVITWNKKNRIPYEMVTTNFEIIRLKGINFALDGLIPKYPYLPTLTSALRSKKFDILHAHSHLFPTTVQAIKEVKRQNKPAVVTVHGVMAKRNHTLNLMQRFYLFSVGSWIFKNSSRVIALTQSDADEIKRYGCPSEKIRIVPNAVDMNFFRPSSKVGNFVFWAGRFVPEKGLHHLLEVAEKVVKEKPYIKFALAGEGPLKSEIANEITERNLRDKILLLGFRSRSEIASIMAHSLCLCFTSLKEGFPKVILEAMACRKPVVAFKIGGLEEIVQDSGILIPPFDVDLMAGRIINLIDDRKHCLALGSKAREIVLRQYSWKTIIDKLERVYQEVV